MSTTYRRIDTTDPRRYDKVKPLTFPAAWYDDSVDLYGFLLSSATMISGMALVTRWAPIAYIGLIFGIANFAHEKQYQAKKESARSAAGPFMTLRCVHLIIISRLAMKSNHRYIISKCFRWLPFSALHFPSAFPFWASSWSLCRRWVKQNVWRLSLLWNLSQTTNDYCLFLQLTGSLPIHTQLAANVKQATATWHTLKTKIKLYKKA